MSRTPSPTSPPSPTAPSATAESHFLPLMRTYFSLSLRLHGTLSLIHSRLQHHRYEHNVHGPPYDRIEHWNRLLTAEQAKYEEIEREWRERDEGLEEGFERRVREGTESLEWALEGVRGEVQGWDS